MIFVVQKNIDRNIYNSCKHNLWLKLKLEKKEYFNLKWIKYTLSRKHYYYHHHYNKLLLALSVTFIINKYI